MPNEAKHDKGPFSAVVRVPHGRTVPLGEWPTHEHPIAEAIEIRSYGGECRIAFLPADYIRVDGKESISLGSANNAAFIVKALNAYEGRDA